ACGRPAGLEELDAVVVGVANEAEQRAALTHAIGLTLRHDPLAREALESGRQVVDPERDVAVPGAELVRPPVVVQRQLELLLLAGGAEEVVRGLELALPDDRQLPPVFETERLGEPAARLEVGDPIHGVKEPGHHRIICTAAERRPAITAQATPADSRGPPSFDAT